MATHPILVVPLLASLVATVVRNEPIPTSTALIDPHAASMRIERESDRVWLAAVDLEAARQMAALGDPEPSPGCLNCARVSPSPLLFDIPHGHITVEFVPGGGRNGQCDDVPGCDVFTCRWTPGEFRITKSAAYPDVDVKIQHPNTAQTMLVTLPTDVVSPTTVELALDGAIDVICAGTSTTKNASVNVVGLTAQDMTFKCDQCQ